MISRITRIIITDKVREVHKVGQEKLFQRRMMDAITYKIIGCAMAVHRELGAGLLEDKYQSALKNALSDASLAFEPQRHYPVYDDPGQHRLTGFYVPDFVVEEIARNP